MKEPWNSWSFSMNVLFNEANLAIHLFLILSCKKNRNSSEKKYLTFAK